MYKKTAEQPEFENFYLPFAGRLKSDNRWIKLSKMIPWEKIEEKYSKNFSNNMGAPAKSVRIALGSMIIKERLGTSDIETLDQITENPYLQYFIGLEEFTLEEPFEASMFVHFRKRFSEEDLSDINEMILSAGEIKQINSDDDEESDNQGKLLVDATCCPADISYPTDLKLLNAAREKTEKIIDKLHEEQKGKILKPRTYRIDARKSYLNISKNRRPRKRHMQKVIRKQLGYIRRNLSTIENQIKTVGMKRLNNQATKELQVINEVYRQQQEMFDKKTHSVSDRIVSISQPHIRPIVRGKAGANTEFGAKISISVINGNCYVDHMNFDSYNECNDLKTQIERFKRRTGKYPESVHADKIYRTKDNRKLCKSLGIRLSGPPLGRPPKNGIKSKALKEQTRQDERDRVPVEGKFGQAKRRFGLGRIKAKLVQTAKTMIALTFIVINLEKRLAQSFLCQIFEAIFWMKSCTNINLYLFSNLILIQ